MNKNIIYITIFALALLLLPTVIRYWNGNQYNINSESYYDARAVHTYDDLESRHVPINILDLLDPVKDLTTGKIVAIMLGIITVILAAVILENHNIGDKNIYAILLLLIVSPIFLYTFSEFSMQGVIILLTLLCIYFLMNRNQYAAAIIFLIMPFIDIYSAILSLIFLFLYLVANNQISKQKIFLLIALAGIAASIILNSISGYNILAVMPLEKSNIVTDIGASFGFSFSALILALIGLILLWEKGAKNLVLYSIIILFLILSVFNTALRTYLNFILVIYAGFAFIYLNRRKWSIQIIKKVTILLIICSILFTSLVFINKLVSSKPDQNYVDALNFLRSQSLPGEGVLSSEGNGYLIEYFAQRPAFIDEKTKYYDTKIFEKLDFLLQSRNLEKTEENLKGRGIKYIFVDNEFKESLKESQGLLFLIENSNKFKSVYTNDDVEIYLYTG